MSISWSHNAPAPRRRLRWKPPMEVVLTDPDAVMFKMRRKFLVLDYVQVKSLHAHLGDWMQEREMGGV